MKRLLVTALAALTLGACATETPFMPASDRTSGHGYSDQRIENDRWRVTFTGNYVTTRQTVESYMLYRAAQVTLDNGFDWFETVKNATGAEITYLGGYPYDSWWAPYGPYWAPEWSYYNSGPWDDDTGYQAQTDIIVHRGPKPPKDPHAFDARQVLAHLGPHILHPEERHG